MRLETLQWVVCPDFWRKSVPEHRPGGPKIEQCFPVYSFRRSVYHHTRCRMICRHHLHQSVSPSTNWCVESLIAAAVLRLLIANREMLLSVASERRTQEIDIYRRAAVKTTTTTAAATTTSNDNDNTQDWRRMWRQQVHRNNVIRLTTCLPLADQVHTIPYDTSNEKVQQRSQSRYDGKGRQNGSVLSQHLLKI